MSKVVAIYSRVSTEKQVVEGFGLDVQTNELVKEAEMKGLQYLEYQDEGISGTSLDKREGLKALLEDIKKGEITEVWVTKLSRLGRNTRDVLNIIHEFEKYNIIFRSVRDSIDTSNHMGKIMLQFMSIISEMERDTIIETTRAGAEYRAMVGKIYGGPKVIGYDRITVDNDTKLVINEEEANIVKVIYKLYRKNMGYKAIVNHLNKNSFRTVNGNLFSIPGVKDILTNPLFAGMIRYNYHKDWKKKGRRGKQDEGSYILVEGEHEAIIPKDRWQEVNDKIASNPGRQNKVTGRFLLAGLLKCPVCGSGMVGAGRKSTHNGKTTRNDYYICGAYHNKGREACSSNGVRVDLVEKLVMDEIIKQLSSDEVVQTLYDYMTNNVPGISDKIKTLNTLKSDLDGIASKESRVVEMYEEGFISRNDMTKKLNKHKEEKANIEALVSELKSSITVDEATVIEVDIEEVKSVLTNMLDIFKEGDDRVMMKKMLRLVVDDIKVLERGKTKLKVNLQFSSELVDTFDIGTKSKILE